ncbi:hypothetical protein VTN02DRAFT_3908 [Thermoascus thermophilus]
MQSVPSLLRQSLVRSSIGLARPSRPSRPVRSPAARPLALFPGTSAARNLSICLRCQFRVQSTSYYSSREEDRLKDEKVAQEAASNVIELGPPSSTSPDLVKGETEAEAKAEAESLKSVSQAESEPQQKDAQDGAGAQHGGSGPSGGDDYLPSHAEGRRSELSKKFTNLMDNLQSNIFIAGQRLNDLTGYSSIEALKREIQDQETKVKETRAEVRRAKEAYAAAINRRSASQREVNELLQRKHAWSPVDLERFTSLYRNDHANEVAETEAQEALSAAERDAEEAAAKLSKSILTRYHEEQIWSDKIRRMSTWGTWGLMGVNVLLFLIFQVAVEPWRRQRLVKGFEEKVIEAIEKENSILRARAEEQGAAAAAATATPSTIIPATTAPDAPAEVDTQAAVTASPGEPSSVILSSEETESDLATTPSQTNLPPAEEPWPSQLSPATVLSVEAWRNTLHDLFSERRIAISQRDLTTVAIESAAAGAAVMGLLIAIFRPR